MIRDRIFMTRRKWGRPVFLLVMAAALGGCAGGIGELVEPAALSGNHPFPLRDASPGYELHEVHGIDVAKYQGEIDWPAVKAAGIGFAFIKATEGSDRIDEKFQQNWAAAKAAGVPRGAYHFNYWCSPIEAQIESFKRVVPVDADAMPPVLDLEWNFDSPTCPKRVPKEQALEAIHKYLRAMEAHYRKRPIVYVDIPFYRDVLAGGELHDYPVWVRSVAAPPQVRYPGRRWAFWQYSAKGRVPGIKPLVDKNVFAGSQQEWRRLVASNFNAPNTSANMAASSNPAAPANPAPPTLVAIAPAPAALPPASADAMPPLPPIRQAGR